MAEQLRTFVSGQSKALHDWVWQFAERSARPLLLAASLAALLTFAPSAAHAQLKVEDFYLDVPAVDSPNIAQYRKLKLSWNIVNTDTDAIGVSGFRRRATASNATVDLLTGSVGNNYIYTDASWQTGVRYEYWLYGYQQHRTYNSATGTYSAWSGGPWESNHLFFTGMVQTVTDNGTADGRLDLRFSTATFKDYKFNNPATAGGLNFLYRGGLYAGYNNDGSVAARTYLKFPFVAPQASGEKLYNKGGLFLFTTRLARTGSASLVCQRTDPSVAWTQANLVWSNAPAPTGTASTAYSVSWNVQSPVAKWQQLPVLSVLDEYVTSVGSGSFAPALTLTVLSQSEGSTGWAYFAKKEYNYASSALATPVSGYGAVLLYAYGGDGAGTGSTGGGGTPPGGGNPPGGGTPPGGGIAADRAGSGTGTKQ